MLLNRHPVFDSVQSLSQGAHDSRSQSVSGLYSNISGGGAIRCNKNGTNITPGQAFTDEWGIGQILPLKKNFSQLLQLGVVGYDQWQVTSNTGLDKNAPFYSVHAAGLQTTYILPEKSVSLFFKYYWQYKAYSTSLGNTLVFGGAWTIRDPKPKPPKQ